MVEFKSIILFDTETTSLPEEDHNTTKITELAFIGCEIEHLKFSEDVPRVMHKLVLVFNPFKLIHPVSTQVSGLSNDLLKNLKGFTKEDVQTLKHFISRLPSPVCIIAQNGNKFDFPILRRALTKVNEELPNNIYCADSLEAFRALIPKSQKSQINSSQIQEINEKTPKHQKTHSRNSLNYKGLSRELFPDEDCLSDWASNNEKQLSSQELSSSLKFPRSYKLEDLYYFFYQKKIPNAHRAENDSEALLQCILKCKDFLPWIKKNAVIFNSIEPLF